MLKKIFVLACTFTLFFNCILFAELKNMDNEELEKVVAQSGVSIEFDNAQYYNEFKNIEFYDSDAVGYVSFKDIVIDDGNGWGYTLNTNQPITIDIVEFSTGILDIDPDYALEIYAPDLEQNKFINIGSIQFNGQDIGKLTLGPIEQKSYKFWLAPPDDNTLGDTDSGLYFKYWHQSHIGEVEYKYNSNESLKLTNLTVANTISGDPKQPSTWVPSGSFLIGKNGGSDGDFARINITRTDLGNIFNHDYRVQMELDLPMSGSLRIENLKIGATSFGPIAIDNINVHKLAITIRP